MRVIKTVVKIAAWTVVLFAASIAIVLGGLWLDHTRATSLPTPSGPFPIGRTTLVWSDATHLDPMAPPAGAKRQLFAWIWYPAVPQSPSQGFDDYLPEPWRKALDQNVSSIFTLFVTRDLSRVRVHSYRDAAVSIAQASYAVVLMRGGAAAQTTQYTCLAEDLASHGYVVVGFDAPYRSMITVSPDGKVIRRAPQNNVELLGGSQQVELATKLAQTWGSDMSFALDRLGELNAFDPSGRFTGRLDLNKVGAFGHSLGGATVLQFCHDDSRCKAGIDVDGLPLGSPTRDGVTQPFMFLLSDHRNEADAETQPVLRDMHFIYDRLPPGKRAWISIRGADHFRFGDGAMLQLPTALDILRRLGIVHLDGRRQVAITEHLIGTFFDIYLKGTAPASALVNERQLPEAEYIH